MSATKLNNRGTIVSRGTVLRMALLAWRYRWCCIWILAVQVMMLTMALSGLGITGLGIDFMRKTLDPAAPSPEWWFGLAPPVSWSPLGVICLLAGAIIVLALIRGSLHYLVVVGTTQLVQRRVVVDLRQQVYNRLHRLSFRFFDENESGSIINRLTADIVNTSLFLSEVFFGLINITIAQIVCLVYMLSIHVKLTLTVMATMPILALATYVFKRLIRQDLQVYHEKNDKMILNLSENLQGIHVVKGFAREPEQMAAFAADNAAVRDQHRRIFWWMSVFRPIIGFLTNVNTIVVLLYGGYLVVLRELDPTHTMGIALGAGLVVFAGLTNQFSEQVAILANLGSRAEEFLVSAARVFEVLDMPMEIHSPSNAVRISKSDGAVRFENVGFFYREKDTVLTDIDFSVEAGQCVALLGPTGTGKSTLLSLIPRFYDPTAGRILLDGTDLRRLHLDDLRRNVGVVFQESFLFSNTIASNIAYGHPDASREKIQRAAKIACAHDFIMELKNGYDTVIGERGADLSGGQRQRLAIARAILQEPSILLLDDPTASIDPDTEHEILQAMDNAMTNRTTFVVAHRFSTLRRADLVIVIDQGQIVQRGTHEQLMGVAHGHYRLAADLQVADDQTIELLGVGTEEFA